MEMQPGMNGTSCPATPVLLVVQPHVILLMGRSEYVIPQQHLVPKTVPGYTASCMVRYRALAVSM